MLWVLFGGGGGATRGGGNNLGSLERIIGSLRTASLVTGTGGATLEGEVLVDIIIVRWLSDDCCFWTALGGGGGGGRGCCSSTGSVHCDIPVDSLK